MAGNPRPRLLTLALVLAACGLVPTALAAADGSCYYASHFVVAAAGKCTPACRLRLADRDGVGSIWPETYKKDGKICCKCQYRNPPVQGDPSPNNSNSDATSDDSDSRAGAKPAAKPAQPVATATKHGHKRIWWKAAIVVSVLALILLTAAGMLFWDCCKCRRRYGKQVADARESAKEARDKQGKRGSLSVESQRKLAALDLAREFRETKLEAQAPARFEVVVTAGASSAPSSPARSRGA